MHIPRNPVSNGRSVIVVGAGLGGLSAAISLAQAGYQVTIYEKNSHAGGKLNMLQTKGFTFDLGPSILTLPHIFQRLFTRSQRRMEDYITLLPVRPHWRNFFENGEKIDLFPETELMDAELARLGASREEFRDFLDYSGRLYDLVNEGYFEKGLDDIGDFRRHYGLRKFLKFDLLRTMHGGVARRIRHPQLRDIMDFFIKYVGSSAYDAPAFMNCLPTIQFRHDLWYVKEGMFALGQA
ncbi:MAG: phytoene desaturase family protein, partial [Kiritimatiellia bacterium]